MGDLPPIALYCSLIFGVRFLEMYGPCARATTATHSTTITTSRTDDDAGSLEDVSSSASDWRRSVAYQKSLQRAKRNDLRVREEVFQERLHAICCAVERRRATHVQHYHRGGRP